MNGAPLSSVRIIDATQNVAGPFCTQILADLGADVIKVEPPAGDSTRGWAPPRWSEQSVMFAAFNRGKRSVVLDLRTPEGRDLLDRLLERADVFVSALRPSTAKRLRLDPETLKATHAGLLVCEISAYGHDGPLAEDAGYDPLIQAFSGLMSLIGVEGSPPVRVPTSIIDMATGMWATIGIIASLFAQRGSRDHGDLVQTSLFESAIAWMPYQIISFLATGEPPRRWGSEFATVVPYGAYETKDRPLMVAVGSESLWRSFCAALGRDDLTDDPRFGTNANRVSNRVELRKIIEGRLKTETASVWSDLLTRAGVPANVLNALPEVLEHPQTAATGMLQVPDGEQLPLVGLPVSIQGVRPPIRRPPAHLGEDTSSVLRDELHLTTDEIDGLAANGIIGSTSEETGDR
jgi:formyl-CoA transferase